MSPCTPHCRVVNGGGLLPEMMYHVPVKITPGMGAIAGPVKHSSNGPISKPPSAGRGCPRWSVGSDVAGSAMLKAGLVLGIAIVCVGPWLYCSGPNCGSAVDLMVTL